MSFSQGLSGLNSASKALDVTGNNIANSSTVGFKSASAHFADVFASSLTGGGASQAGIGVTLAAVQQQFTQGNITSTNNPLDIAINGGGFFRMDQAGSITFSRNGQFHLDKDGFVVNDQSMNLTGFQANATGQIIPGSPAPLQISAAQLAPVATGGSVGGSFQGVQAVLNLDSRSTAKVWAAPAVGNPSPNAYNYSTALSVYDTLGNAHNLALYFTKPPLPAPAGTWEVHMNIDGTAVANSSTTATLTFDSSGQLTAGSPLSIPAFSAGPPVVGIDLGAIATATGIPNNATIPAFDIDFTGTSQFGSAFASNRLEQDGYATGQMVGVSVGADGIVQGNYSNGQTRNQGQVVLAKFTNPNGLQSLGNNQWVNTSVSGTPLVDAPATSGLGALQAAAIEESNVDLTAELVLMITEQRNYQANAQTIKTMDQVMQTLVNLR